MPLAQNILLGLRMPLSFLLASIGVLGALTSRDVALLVTFIFGAFILRRHSIRHRIGLGPNVLRKIFGFSIGNHTPSLLAIAPATYRAAHNCKYNRCPTSAYFCIAYAVASLPLKIPDAVTMVLFVEGAHKMPLKEMCIKLLRLIMISLLLLLAVILLFGDKTLSIFSGQYAVQ